MRFLLQTAAIGFAAYFVGRLYGLHDRTDGRGVKAAGSAVELRGVAVKSDSSGPESKSTQEPIWDRIVEVLKSRDSYQCAEKLVPLVEGVSKEDLANAVDAPFDTANLYGRPDDGALENAFTDAVVRRWMKIDPDEVEEAILKRPIVWLQDAYARVRPEKVIEQYAFDAEDSPYQFEVETAFQRLAERDVASARRYAERIVNPERRKKADEAMALGVAPSDPVMAADLARKLDSWYVFHAAVEGAAKIGRVC